MTQTTPTPATDPAGTVVGGMSSGDWVTSYAMVQPRSLAASGLTDTGFTANWEAPPIGPTPSTYYLDVARDAAFDDLVAGYDGLDVGTSLSRAVGGLTYGTTCYWRVRAGSSSASGRSIASVTRVTATGLVGGNMALEFDGSNQHVSIPAHPLTQSASFL